VEIKPKLINPPFIYESHLKHQLDLSFLNNIKTFNNIKIKDVVLHFDKNITGYKPLATKIDEGNLSEHYPNVMVNIFYNALDNDRIFTTRFYLNCWPSYCGGVILSQFTEYFYIKIPLAEKIGKILQYSDLFFQLPELYIIKHKRYMSDLNLEIISKHRNIRSGRKILLIKKNLIK